MAKKGYIYKGLKPVYWSPSSESALAEAEIEYHDKRSPSIYVAFDVTDGKEVLDGGEKIIIWTTTPWTIPANLGIAIHPELEYAVVAVNGEKYVIAHELVETLTEELEWENPEVIKTFKGEEADRVVARHPFYDRDSLVMLGDHVTTDAGTGCVHTAPGHGEDDFYMSRTYGIEPFSPVDGKGHFTSEAPGLEGMFYDQANKTITEKLEESGALLKLTFITHSYPHDWRTKKRLFSGRHRSGLHPLKIFARIFWMKSIASTGIHHGEKPVCTIWYATVKTGAFPGSGLGVFQSLCFTGRMERQSSIMKPLPMFLICLLSTARTLV